MNKLVLFVFAQLFSVVVLSQHQVSDFDRIIESETKAALRTIDATNVISSNTGNYDITYHKLDFNIDPAVAFISGEITTTFTAKSDMTSIVFDFDDNMNVIQVTQEGVPLSFTHNTNDELIINLETPILQGNSGTVIISYDGNPASSGFGSFEQTTHGPSNTPIIWTLSEPYGANAWWPCKQDLNDKIEEIDVYITAPSNYVSVANGIEQSAIVTGMNKTTHFKHQYPIPAYLIAIAITNYEVYSHTVPNNGNPFEIVNYVYPESLATASASTPITVDLITFFSNLFENYPFENEKYGHAQFGWGGGMEHTTVSFMGSWGRGLIAHELAHQWFGDKVTCGSWKDIWLNEGFATYLDGLSVENFDGVNAFRSWKQNKINNITSATNGYVYLHDTDTTNVGRVFNGRLTYNKGAMVIHMLRKKLGDTAFFQAIKNYLADTNLAYDYAKTDDLKAHLETVSGIDLTEFFNDWIYKEGYPTYTVAWNQLSASEIKIVVNQEQSHSSVSFFEGNVPIRINGTEGEVLDIELNNTFSGQEFYETISFAVASVEFDPDFDLISRNNSVVSGVLDNDKPLLLYPNPTSDVIYIQKPDNLIIETVDVYNVLGQLVLSKVWNTNNLEVTSLSSGLYFVNIKTAERIFSKSFVKN